VRSLLRFYVCLRFALLFVCFNYPTFRICNQPCIAFIYLLFIFSFAVDGKRAPTVIGRGSFPRSRTGCDIFGFGNRMGAASTYVSILYSYTGCVAGFALGHFPDFNLMQSRRLLPFSFFRKKANLSIFRSHTDCFGNSTQRLHLAYNIALCALPFLML